MNVLGLTITRTKAAVGRSGGGLLTAPVSTHGSGWLPMIREAFAGAWQRNITMRTEDVTAHATAWACMTLIASDISKLRLKLLKWDGDISTETTNPAYSPILRKPNHYQNRITFLKSWVLSKLNFGNTYILKERDERNVVSALYPLNPTLVQVLTSADGQVFYALGQDYLSGITTGGIVVPSREIIHDIHIPLYHPLVGVSPIHACGRSVMQALKMQANTDQLFENGAMVSGILTAPHSINNDNAARLQKQWDDNFGGARNAGKVAVLGDGLKFEPMVMNAVDAQLIDQLKWGDEKICSTYHVPGYMVGVGPAPSYNNIEALSQQYYSQCLQELIECIELCLDEGLGLNDQTGVELDLEGLIRMDSNTKMDMATKGVTGGIFKPNEARSRFNLKPVPGGDTPYLQQQNYSLAALNKRDTSDDPFKTTTSEPPRLSARDDEALDDDKSLTAMKRIAGPLLRVALKKAA